MKSPIGDSDFCEEEVGKRVDRALHIAREIAKLYKKHCARNLLRYQEGRMGYIKRTTPVSSCRESLRKFDAGIKEALETILGRGFTAIEWQQVVLPVRHGGIGIRKAEDTADEAYSASLFATRSICTELGSWDSQALFSSLMRTNAA